MNAIHVSAQLLAPTVVKQDRHSERSEGTRSLSGSVIRGALAQLYLHEVGPVDDAFRRLFLDETRLRFGPLDPGPQLVPPTALSCKREPGFETDGKHGIVDNLWCRIRQRLEGSANTPNGGEGLHACSHKDCHADRKGYSGFWQLREGSPHSARGVRTVIGTHVGIDRLTQSAAESILYTLSGLEGDLVGTWHGTPEAIEDLKRLLDRNGGEVRVGHHRSRGYGNVRLHLEGDEPAASPDRWLHWNEGLNRFLERDDPREFTFAVSLPAGAILLDATLRYSLDPAEMVPWLPPLPAPEEPAPNRGDSPGRAEFGGRLWCLCAHARHERIRGWQAAHGLPRQDEFAVSRGAVYAYHFRGPEEGRRALLHALENLESEGVGARRVEGFGRVVVSDAFHQLCAPENLSCR